MDTEWVWSPTQKPNWNYFLCSNCHYLQMFEQDIPTHQAELERYQHHQNEDTSYREYFEGFVKCIEKHFDSAESKILDFGCGPYPMLSQVLRSKNYSVQSYDPNFFPEAVSTKFDVIILHEVLEHLREPFAFFDSLRTILKPQGKLIVSTKFYRDRQHFETWSYRRDQTHIGFFNSKSFQYIEKKWAAKILEIDDPILVFQFE